MPRLMARVVSLVNEYPKITHTFVRNEIAALEQAGVVIERVAARRSQMPLLDAADQLEAARTRTILDLGVHGLAAHLTRTAAAEPQRFAGALKMALRLARREPGRLPYHLAYLAEACVLRSWFGVQIDHVHAHFGSNPAAVALLWRLLGGPPYSFAAHGPEEFVRASALAIDEKAAHAAFVVVVSEAGRAALGRICPPAYQNRVHVVRCGIDARFEKTPPTPVPADRRLVFVGRLVPDKAPLLLIEAAARLSDEVDFELCIIGDGPLRDDAEQLVRTHRLQQRVRLLGWRGSDDIRRHLLAARALVLPSFAEGLPVAFMEAFALQRPVIATPVGGVAELVEDGVNGWLVPPGEVAPLAAALRAALNEQPSRLAEMGQHGAERVRRQHDGLAEGRKLAELFRSSIATNSNADHRSPNTEPRQQRSEADGSVLGDKHCTEWRPADGA